MKYNCEKCHDSGFLLYEKTLCGLPYIFSQECPFCHGEGQTEKAKQAAQMPSQLYDVKIEDFDWTVYKKDDLTVIETEKKQKTVWSMITNFPEWSRQGNGLYIYSKTKGSGKTFLASAIVNTLIERYGLKAKFVSASDLIRLDQEKDFDPYADRYTTSGVDKLITCDLLVIDDLGVGNAGSGWREDILYRIVDKRMNSKKPIIFTSNVRLDELPVDDRVADRINSITFTLALPEVKVRASKAEQDKKKFLESVGITA